MHKKLYNQAKIGFIISPVTPLSIKAGDTGADPSRPDMEFVRTHHIELGETVFIPGSSLKGVFRSYSEKLLRTVHLDCCNPVADNPSYPADEMGSCSNYFNKAKENIKGLASNGPKIYKLNDRNQKMGGYSCYACQLYGSTAVSSHIRFTDAYPINPENPGEKMSFEQLVEQKKINLEKRDGVAIDRILGSVAVGPFDLEVLSVGTFCGELFLKNFQWWQLALLGLTFRDIDDGFVQLGFSKSRGLGRVNILPTQMEIVYFSEIKNGSTLPGIGKQAEAERDDYGFRRDDEIVLQQPQKPVTDWLRSTYSFSQSERGGQVDMVFKAAVDGPWKSLVMEA